MANSVHSSESIAQPEPKPVSRSIRSMAGGVVTFTADAINRMNREGLRGYVKDLDIVGKAREALAKMPSGKSGLVLGSGPNTETHRAKVWKTLDIDVSAGVEPA